ncbi:MAG: hypothetical protein JW837_18745 [Sedimentisphaerales bacterium]|nr:hypothetical protein [Sedimentisphaerales bacterium]
MVSDIVKSIDKVLKINDARTGINQRARFLLIVLSLVLVQFAGCLPAPSSPLTKITAEPPDFPLIRLDSNVCQSKRLYNYLIRAGKGKIGPHENADYIITRLDLNSVIEIGFHKAHYRLFCEVSDKHNRKVIETFAGRLVKGDFEPGTDYSPTATRRYEDFIAKDAANQLLNDLYKKMPAVLAAAP